MLRVSLVNEAPRTVTIAGRPRRHAQALSMRSSHHFAHRFLSPFAVVPRWRERCAAERRRRLPSWRGDRRFLPYTLARNPPAVPVPRPRPARSGVGGGTPARLGRAAAGSRKDADRTGGRPAAGPPDRRPGAEHRDPEPVDRALALLHPPRRPRPRRPAP